MNEVSTMGGEFLNRPESFNGFPTMKLETLYNKSVFAMLFLLQNTLLRFFHGGM